MSFTKAVKHESKIRMSIAGPSGSGKTWTSLVLATALADGQPIAVIDTERGSASKYSDLFSFDVMELDTFHPDKFVEGIHDAEKAGYAVLIIDSLSHAWNGTGGLLEIVEAISKRSKSGNSFTAWGEATPIQNRLIDAITRAKLHIICTMRSKQEYVLESNNGKMTPRKVGMAPVQRADLEYEFDIFGEMDHENSLIIQKSRCPALSGAVIPKPDSKVADVLKIWLSGAPAPVVESPSPADVDAIRTLAHQVYVWTDEQFEEKWAAFKMFVLETPKADPDLSKVDLKRLEARARDKARQAKATTNAA
jgi:AAA domain